MSKFEQYPKTPRLSSVEMTITEKIDGTNVQVVIEDGQIVCVGSRNREIFPDIPALRDENGRTVRDENGKPVRRKVVRDQFGFAQWVEDNAEGLVAFLGDGRHYGEWAGPGIQKNPLGLPRRMFFVFNVQRHTPERFEQLGHLVPDLRGVPILYCGKFDIDRIEREHAELLMYGTRVAEAVNPKQPEGIVVSAFGTKLKMTDDNRPKGTR